MLYALLAALGFALGANWWDSLNTVKCIAKGYVESNSYVDALVGNKPTLWQLIAITQGIIFAIFVVGFLFVHTPLAAGAIVALAVAGIKHILGARAGARLLKG
jgi:hypothetical protein